MTGFLLFKLILAIAKEENVPENMKKSFLLMIYKQG